MSDKQRLRLWLRLLSCATAIEKKARAMLVARFDTTLPRFDVMAALDREPDGLTMSALSIKLDGMAPFISPKLSESLQRVYKCSGLYRILWPVSTGGLPRRPVL